MREAGEPSDRPPARIDRYRGTPGQQTRRGPGPACDVCRLFGFPRGVSVGGRFPVDAASGRTRIRLLPTARKPRQTRSSESRGWLAGRFATGGPLSGRFVTNMLGGRGCPNSASGIGNPATTHPTSGQLPAQFRTPVCRTQATHSSDLHKLHRGYGSPCEPRTPATGPARSGWSSRRTRPGWGTRTGSGPAPAPGSTAIPAARSAASHRLSATCRPADAGQ